MLVPLPRLVPHQRPRQWILRCLPLLLRVVLRIFKRWRLRQRPTGATSYHNRPRGVPPPGFRVVRRTCASRQYNVFVAPDGVVYRSASSAWDSLPSLPSVALASSAATVPEALVSAVPVTAISDELSGLLVAFSIPLSDLPPGVLSCLDAAFHADCPPYLAAVAQAHVAMVGPDILMSFPSGSVAPLMPPPLLAAWPVLLPPWHATLPCVPRTL